VGDEKSEVRGRRTDGGDQKKGLKRIILDSMARTPLDARVVADEFADLTTIVVSRHAPKNRVAALGRKVRVLVAPAETQNPKLKTQNLKIDLRWLLRQLGAEDVTHVLVEGGGEASASFLLGGFAQRVVFFYAPKVLGGRDSRKSVAGNGAARLAEALRLRDLNWEESGVDLILTARVADRS
jgi:diaminohydroxyphosphoribosylaminopyrimidine deaminase/5-amino-6-(5-phosphoribosylamino)uracil reductase